jgi:transposase-like protein
MTRTQKYKVYSNFSLSLDNVCARLEMAELYQIESLISACVGMIKRNLNMMRRFRRDWMIEEILMRIN